MTATVDTAALAAVAAVKVERGAPTPDELAAVVAVLAACGGAEDEAPPARPRHGGPQRWAARPTTASSWSAAPHVSRPI